MTRRPAAPARLNRTGVATRAKIIEAAIAVLAERGFPGFTLQAVADRAGVLYGSVTHHYGTRERLVEAMLEALLAAYRERFDALAASLQASQGSPVGVLVEWLLDDAVERRTAATFLSLWAMASYAPALAQALNRLYDDAVLACVAALGLPPASSAAGGLREALYLLGTVLEGSSAIFANRGRRTQLYQAFRRDARALLVPLLERRLREARRKARSAAPGARSAPRPGGRSRD